MDEDERVVEHAVLLARGERLRLDRDVDLAPAQHEVRRLRRPFEHARYRDAGSDAIRPELKLEFHAEDLVRVAEPIEPRLVRAQRCDLR
jgi:hypothetical protein